MGSERALNVFWKHDITPFSPCTQYITAAVFVNHISMNFEMFDRKRHCLLQCDRAYMQMAAATATLSDSNCAISIYTDASLLAINASSDALAFVAEDERKNASAS